MKDWIKIKDGLWMKVVSCGNLYACYNDGYWDTEFCNGDTMNPVKVHIRQSKSLGVAKSSITKWYYNWQTQTADNHIGTFWYRYREHGATRVWKQERGVIMVDFVYASQPVDTSFCSRPYVRPIADLQQYRHRTVMGLKEGKVLADLWSMRH